MKILIIKLDAMGDVMRTSAILGPLKEMHPDSVIHWVTRENARELLENDPRINGLFFMESIQVADWEKKPYDWVISLDEEKNACELSSIVDATKRSGTFWQDGKCAYTMETAEWFDMGLASRFGKEKADEFKCKNQRTYPAILFDMLSLAKDSTQYPPRLFLSPESIARAQLFAHQNDIQPNDTVIGINTGAGGRWQDKKLSIEQTIDLIERLSKKTSAKLVLFGGPEEKERNAAILKAVGKKALDAGCDNTLSDFGARVQLCQVVITSDSLALHVSIGLGKKVVAFFYPTSAAEIELYGKGVKIIAQGKSYCSYEVVCSDPPKWNIAEIANAAIKLL